MFDIDHLYLASYNYGKINETVVTGGDNFEVTVGLSKTEGLTEEQLEQNGLLDCMMTLLKDVENSINCLYRSIDNDTDLAESLSKQLPISKSNKHLAYNFGTLHEQVERRNDYINGKKGIGPFALNVTNQMLTYLFGVKFKDTKFTKFTGIWRLDHLVDDNDAYISSWLSAFINANVDIVKDPWVVRLNVNPFTYNILNLLVRSGMGQTGVWFLCQPIIRELASVEERTKSNFSKDPSLPKYKFKQKLIEQVLDKYLIQHDDATISEYTTNSDAQSIQSRIDVVNLILDNKDALRYIAVNPNATMVKLNDGSDVSVSWFQGQIYYAFLSLQKYIQAMNKLVQYTKIDTRKHGKNFIQIQRYLAMYNELFHPQDTSKSLWDLESLKNLADNSWIEYKTVNAINLPLRILANQVYTANPDFSSVVLHFARRLARSASGEYGFTEDLIKKLSNGLQTAIKARYMSAYAKQVLGRSDEYVRELFYGSSPLISIARRLNGLKYAIESVPEFERLKGNYIIEKLRPQPQQESVALSDGSVARQPQFITIDSNIDGSRTDENMMIDAWKDLLNDPNERVRMFAEDLILYTFFTTGESKGWNKLFKYVPSAWIRGEIRGGTVDVDDIQCTSFSDYVEQTLNGRMPDLIPMLQEVVSNNFLNYGMCTTMQLKNEDGTYNFINPDASSPVLVANAVSISDIDSMPLYISVKKPNTKGRKAGSYNVYKMTGEINATNGVYPIYTMIEKRGYSQFNNDIYEYGIDLQYKENETKIPNVSAEEIESRISDVCEKIENTGKQGHKWTWNEILIDLTGAFYGESANDDIATDEQSSVPSEPNMTQQSESQPSQATSGIKYESDGGVSVEYTPTGKQRQTYTVKGNKIFNKNGDEVFKEDSVDRNKIFANLAVLQGRAVIVEHKGIKYVVNNRNQIISGATGKIMQWGEENGDRNAIIQAAEKRFKENGVKAAMEKSVHEAHKDVLNTLGGDEQAESEINSAVKTAVAGVALSEVLDKIEPVFTEEERAQITEATKGGKLQVMSVSRMTDPVFFTKEIIKFFEENAKKPFTDPTRVNAIEIWSKHDGMPMQDLLRACKKYKVAPMVSFSITGLGNTSLERGVMKYNDLIDRIEKLVESGDLNPNTTTVRIDPILVGETNFEDVKTIVNRCKQIGIKKFVTSLVQSYGYLDGTSRDRKVVSGINEAMERDGRTYDWDKYYGRITKEDYDASKVFVQQYQSKHPKASWSEIISVGAAQGVRVVTQSSIGKIHFIPKQQYIDEIGKILLEINKDPEIELETCSFFIKGLRASACLDPLIIERITGVDVTDENGRYNRDTSRPDCMCYGAHSDMFRMNEKKCFSSCAYCYAGKSDSNAISYYNEDGTLKDTIYTRTYESETSDSKQQTNEVNEKSESNPFNVSGVDESVRKQFAKNSGISIHHIEAPTKQDFEDYLFTEVVIVTTKGNRIQVAPRAGIMDLSNESKTEGIEGLIGINYLLENYLRRNPSELDKFGISVLSVYAKEVKGDKYDASKDHFQGDYNSYINSTNSTQIEDSGLNKPIAKIDALSISNKTETFGVHIDPNIVYNYKAWLNNNKNGIVAYRMHKDRFNTKQNVEEGIIGNPFDWRKYGAGKCLQMFADWLMTGNDFGENLANDEYRSAIINKLLSIDEPNILYYKELNRPSHATVLGYLIEHKELLQSAMQPIKTEKTPKNYQKYIDVIQKYFDIGYTTGRIGKDDAKQVIQKLHIHIDENSELFDAMKINNLSETDLLNALYMLASHLDKPEVTGRTKLSDQQVDKLLDDMKNSNILTDILNMDGGIYRIHESNDGLIIDTKLMSDLDFLLQNKKYEPIYRQLLNYMMNDKYMDEYYGDIVDIFNIDHEDLSGLIQVDSTFDNVNQLELFSDKDFEQGRKNKENCKGK